jgi:glycosyltransferase involved in cell wall biosynthesis
MNHRKSLSIVTVAMNRSEHLSRSAKAIARSDVHDEHIIIDWGSEDPIELSGLPRDSRVVVYRVNNVSRWWLTHAYNLGFSLASGSLILKCDADILLEPNFFDRFHGKENIDLHCPRATLQEWSLHADGLGFCSNGLFLISRRRLDEIRGFNPYLENWGWDEIDLYSRVFLSGGSMRRIRGEGVEEITHGDDLRVNQKGSFKINISPFIARVLDRNMVMRANIEKNKAIAGRCIYSGLGWPSQREYKDRFIKTATPPEIPPVTLFSEDEFEALCHSLFFTALALKPIERRMVGVWQRLGVGGRHADRVRALREVGILTDLVNGVSG